MPARLLTLDDVADILWLSPRQVHLLAPQGADPLPLAVAFLAQATLDAPDGGGGALGVAAARGGGAR